MRKALRMLELLLVCSMIVIAGCKKDDDGGNNNNGGGTNANVPTVITDEVTDITSTTAVCGGEVTDDNGYAVITRGVCWSTTPNPTFSSSHTLDGEGMGNFTSTLTGLESETTYYVRAYAVNEKGTGYGEEKSFTTTSGGGTTTITVNGVTFNMIEVEGGTFYMGAQSTDPDGQNYDSEAYYSESPVHEVTLSSYYIGETEVTQELWQAVTGSNPSYFSGTNLPVEYVSWNDIQDFITQLNALTGMTFRLPTEAEWEYAARGGRQSHGYKYSGSNNIDDVAWYGYYDGGGTATSYTTYAVGTKSPNELGIYDMSGNVWEWCQDWYGDYSSGSQTNPAGASSGSYRVTRGGGWNGSAWFCRVSFRYNSTPGNSHDNLGFRLAASPQ